MNVQQCLKNIFVYILKSSCPGDFFKIAILKKRLLKASVAEFTFSKVVILANPTAATLSITQILKHCFLFFFFFYLFEMLMIKFLLCFKTLSLTDKIYSL